MYICKKIIEMSDYHDKVRKLREFRNYTQEYMAEQLNLSQRAYSSLENGKTQLSVDRLIEICNLLNVPIGEVLDIENQNIYNNNFNNNAENNHGNLIFKKDDFEEQRKLYERIIEIKDNEIAFLKEQLTQKA